MAYRRVAKVRVEMVKEKSVYCKSKELSSPDLAAWFARSLLFSEEGDELRCPTKEIMLVICTDRIGKPLVVEHVTMGTATGTLVGMKELFTSAILSNATELICVHNHPSGNPLPSMADQLMTKRIQEAAKILDIPMRDHIILGDEGFYSYQEKQVTRWEDVKLQEVS